MGEALQRAWLRRGAMACLLWPFSLVFALLAALRRAAFRAGLLRSERVGIPVVIIGNVIAGGAGKTPIVRAVTEHLKARGIRVGVVSRGHGRAAGDCREVRPDSHAREVGDEPLLIARSCAVPVFVAPRRAEAARALLHEHPRTQLIVSDDGLQHYALQRDLEICVFDDRGIGNGWLLPAGPLREPWPRRVDLALRTPGAAGIRGFQVRRRLAAHAYRADGTRADLVSLRGRALCAVAGIASPEAFFGMLRSAGLTLSRTIALPDHHAFEQPLDIEGELVCTEKDAVKLWRVRPDAWAVPLEVDIDEDFWRTFDRLVDAKL
jgi:tetraacyldisaccharide 4'-kinase